MSAICKRSSFSEKEMWHECIERSCYNLTLIYSRLYPYDREYHVNYIKDGEPLYRIRLDLRIVCTQLPCHTYI